MDKAVISTYNLNRMETYRSGHNGAHSKCVSLSGHEGSNPSVSVPCSRGASGVLYPQSALVGVMLYRGLSLG